MLEVWFTPPTADGMVIMQMRKSYETTNKLQRIENYKKAATECEAKGFPGTAEVNREMAALLQSEIDAANKAARLAAEEDE